MGDINITTLRCQVTSITALSDQRDKTEIVDLEPWLDFVNGLRPVRFTWAMREESANNGKPSVGFIAQELKSLQEQMGITVPSLVYESNPDRIEASYGTLIPILVQSIKDLTAKVNKLNLT